MPDRARLVLLRKSLTWAEVFGFKIDAKTGKTYSASFPASEAPAWSLLLMITQFAGAVCVVVVSAVSIQLYFE